MKDESIKAWEVTTGCTEIANITKSPHNAREMIAQAKDLLSPNKNILIMVPVRPVKITGLRPIRSDSIPQCIPARFRKEENKILVT